jgi:hypothetical protein
MNQEQEMLTFVTDSVTWMAYALSWSYVLFGMNKQNTGVHGYIPRQRFLAST